MTAIPETVKTEDVIGVLKLLDYWSRDNCATVDGVSLEGWEAFTAIMQKGWTLIGDPDYWQRWG